MARGHDLNAPSAGVSRHTLRQTPPQLPSRLVLPLHLNPPRCPGLQPAAPVPPLCPASPPHTGVQLPVVDYDNLRAAIVDNCQRSNLQPLETFMIKVIQLYEMIVVRHGLMLVGQSFGMKTSAIRWEDSDAAGGWDVTVGCWQRGWDGGRYGGRAVLIENAGGWELCRKVAILVHLAHARDFLPTQATPPPAPAVLSSTLCRPPSSPSVPLAGCWPLLCLTCTRRASTTSGTPRCTRSTPSPCPWASCMDRSARGQGAGQWQQGGKAHQGQAYEHQAYPSQGS